MRRLALVVLLTVATGTGFGQDLSRLGEPSLTLGTNQIPRAQPTAATASVAQRVAVDINVHQPSSFGLSSRAYRRPKSAGHVQPSGHRRVYQEVKSWNPASKSYVDGRDQRTLGNAQSYADRKSALALAEAKGYTDGKVGGNQPNYAGSASPSAGEPGKEKNMEAFPWWGWLILTGLVALGLWFWSQRPQPPAVQQGPDIPYGLGDPNRTPTSVLDPHSDVRCELFEYSSPAFSYRKVTPVSVAVARVQNPPPLPVPPPPQPILLTPAFQPAFQQGSATAAPTATQQQPVVVNVYNNHIPAQGAGQQQPGQAGARPPQQNRGRQPQGGNQPQGPQGQTP